MRIKPSWLLGCLFAAGLIIHLDASSAPATDIQVKDAWIRWLPADIPAGGYVTLINTATVDRVLVAVTSPAFGEVGIHQTLDDHGVSTMRSVESVTLKPRVPFRFMEGGYHLMLMQPVRPIHPGDAVVMTFRFSQGAPVDIVFKVRASN